jgi:hypothetical protein
MRWKKPSTVTFVGARDTGLSSTQPTPLALRIHVARQKLTAAVAVVWRMEMASLKEAAAWTN